MNLYYSRKNLVKKFASTFVLIVFLQTANFAISLEYNISELDLIISSNPASFEKIQKSTIHGGIIFNFRNLLTGIIKFYQLFISTQDIPVCNFTPSCSQFGIEAIQRFGIIRGILLTSDRLQRCNGMSVSRYQIDHITGKLSDPIKIYSDLK